ncbi:UNVERIFIED_CONTAM: hypothetical protein Sindi_1227100 [Sesamum indicum]
MSKTLMGSWRLNISILFLGRTRRLTMKKEDDDVSVMTLKYFQEKEKYSSPGADERLYFTKLPKGVPIPPSAPSKRHNSSPQN